MEPTCNLYDLEGPSRRTVNYGPNIQRKSQILGRNLMSILMLQLKKKKKKGTPLSALSHCLGQKFLAFKNR